MKPSIAGGLYGLLIGDAVGVPYEFHVPQNLPPLEQLDMEPPAGFRRAHWQIPPGTWSDDGAQALCLLASLLDLDRLDPEDLARRFVRWYHEGYMAVDSKVFDIGNTTSDAMIRFEKGAPAIQAGPRGERDNGNGSLMRVLPLAMWHRGRDIELVRDAHLQSRITHGHPRALVCCALYCLWARRILQEASEPWDEAIATLRRLYQPHPVLLEELDGKVLPPFTPSGSGYVVDALHSARAALDAGPYEAVIRRAIAFGKDTDTTACIAGGIAGLQQGVEAIPRRWRDGLRGSEIVEALLERLLAR